MSAFPTRFLLSAPTFRSSRKIVRMMHARFLVVVRCVQCIDNARPRSGSRLVVVRLFPRSREDESNLIIYCYLALKLFDRLRRFGNWSQLDLRKRFFFFRFRSSVRTIKVFSALSIESDFSLLSFFNPILLERKINISVRFQLEMVDRPGRGYFCRVYTHRVPSRLDICNLLSHFLSHKRKIHRDERRGGEANFERS